MEQPSTPPAATPVPAWITDLGISDASLDRYQAQNIAPLPGGRHLTGVWLTGGPRLFVMEVDYDLDDLFLDWCEDTDVYAGWVPELVGEAHAHANSDARWAMSAPMPETLATSAVADAAVAVYTTGGRARGADATFAYLEALRLHATECGAPSAGDLVYAAELLDAGHSPDEIAALLSRSR